jgi:sulfoxide reductase catalytic subunit YedY
MLIKKTAGIPYSEIAPKSVYINRRKFLAEAAAAVGAAALVARPAARWLEPRTALAAGTKLDVATKSPFSSSEKQTPFEIITNYNNYYEFSTDKSEVARLATNFKTSPWTVSVEGEVMKPQKFSVDDLMKLAPLEERVFRHRCVEAWSIVVPWIGYSLSALINKVQPTAKAKYVQFFSDVDPKQMPGLAQGGLDWPYREGLRMDEAMHPLATLCFGLYGQVLPNPNGAPLRTVLPWKYGFKCTKAIVKIVFVQNQPATSWNTANANEYGFYSNVNPNVDHPRWSQKTERRLGGSILSLSHLPTQMFNGYGEVASLYNGMDLKKYY